MASTSLTVRDVPGHVREQEGSGGLGRVIHSPVFGVLGKHVGRVHPDISRAGIEVHREILRWCAESNEGEVLQILLDGLCGDIANWIEYG